MGKTHKDKLQRVTLTMQEIWKETAPKVHKSKKAYTRKTKHKTNY